MLAVGEPVEPMNDKQLSPSTGSGNDLLAAGVLGVRSATPRRMGCAEDRRAEARGKAFPLIIIFIGLPYSFISLRRYGVVW